MRITLITPLATIVGVGPRFAEKLARLNLRTVRDLLWHFPSRYEDFSHLYRIADLEPGIHATVQGRVETIEARRSWRRRWTILEAVIADDSGSIRAVWFNQSYLQNTLRVGLLANFSGKVARSEEDIYLSHPTFEFISPHETGEMRHTGRLIPVYPETRGLTSKGIRAIVKPVLEHLEPLAEWIPGNILRAEALPELEGAIQDIHYPRVVEDALAAKRRFAFEDLFLLQLMNAKEKRALAREKAPVIRPQLPLLTRIVSELPFALTLSQKKSLWEVLKDMERSSPMNRLLQGDVGAGKTVVAALAATLAATEGRQTAFLAPTEVLARQHYETLKKLFRDVRALEQPATALLTGSEAKILFTNDLEDDFAKGMLREKVRRGEVAIVIGTHALIEKSVAFRRLGLVIVDEQHRFGVEQRARLAKAAGRGRAVPHFLSMSATPIPRTLMLTVFGDLDVSTITELPAGRKRILTKVVAPANRAKAYDFIRGEVKKGRQAFVICPRIEPDVQEESPARFDARRLEIKSVKEEYEKLAARVFPHLRIAMLHGQMRPKEKEATMKRFHDGDIDVLVSTSVVEVGVDVPNATIMMIEGSERFGLSQLYQFRGRVGRGAQQSFCFLFTESESAHALARLKAIVEAKSGFELAERDLAIRGPGEFLGERQTGLPDIAMRALQDRGLIVRGREAARALVEKDATLARFPLLRERLEAFRERLHRE